MVPREPPLDENTHRRGAPGTPATTPGTMGFIELRSVLDGGN